MQYAWLAIFVSIISANKSSAQTGDGYATDLLLQ
jgi:hypothetical protein